MANLQIKGIDESLYSQIKKMASKEHRSISQQVLYLVKDYMAKNRLIREGKPPGRVLLELSGSWEDERNADQIIEDIKLSQRSSKKLKSGL